MKKTMFVMIALFSLSCAVSAFSEQRTRPVLEFTNVTLEPPLPLSSGTAAEGWSNYQMKSFSVPKVEHEWYSDFLCDCGLVHMTYTYISEYNVKWPGILMRKVILPYWDYSEMNLPNGLIDLYGNKENYSCVVTPDRVELVKMVEDDKQLVETETLSDIEPGQLFAVDSARLQYWLSSDSSFDWEGENICDCGDNYAYRVKFWRGEKAVCVDLDFISRQVRVVVDDQVVASTGLEPTRDSLKSLVEYYFPELLLVDY